MADQQRTNVAVLLGTSDYTDQHLPPLPGAATSLHRMRRLLTGPRCGWASGNVKVYENLNTPSEVLTRLIELYGSQYNVALFYFVGHGLLDADQLCLGLGHSRNEPGMQRWTGLPYTDVKRVIEDVDAHYKVIILDCCYSGRAVEMPYTPRSRRHQERVFVMTANTGFDLATTEIDGQDPQTLFTKAFVDLVEAGIDGGPQQLDLRSIYQAVRDALDDKVRRPPATLVMNDADALPFASNAKYVAPTPTNDPAEILDGTVMIVYRGAGNMAITPEGTFEREIRGDEAKQLETDRKWWYVADNRRPTLRAVVYVIKGEVTRVRAVVAGTWDINDAGKVAIPLGPPLDQAEIAKRFPTLRLALGDLRPAIQGRIREYRDL